MTQMDLVRLMEQKGLTGTYRQHVSEALKGKITPLMARKIEIALDLPRFSLVKATGTKLNNLEMERIERIEKNLKGL